MQSVVTGIVAVYRDKGAYLAFPFLLVYSMLTLTESVTMTYNDLHWVLFVAIAVKLGFPDRPENYNNYSRLDDFENQRLQSISRPDYRTAL
jgi:hypothetical protein